MKYGMMCVAFLQPRTSQSNVAFPSSYTSTLLDGAGVVRLKNEGWRAAFIQKSAHEYGTTDVELASRRHNHASTRCDVSGDRRTAADRACMNVLQREGNLRGEPPAY